LKVKLGLPSNLFANLEFKDALREVSRLNPEAVEVVFDKPHFEISTADESRMKLEVRDAIRSLGSHLEFSAHACFQKINLASLNPADRKRSIKLIGKCLRVSGDLGLKVVVLHPGYLPRSFPWLRWLIPNLKSKAKNLMENSLKECLRMAEDHGVMLALENVHGLESLIQTPSEAFKLASKFPELKLTVDVGHLYLEARRRGLGEGLAERWVAEEISRLPKGVVVHLHLHDNYGFKDDHLPPGEGKIDFRPIVDALRAIDFEGQVILEVWSPERPQESGAKALEEARKLLSLPC